MEFAPIVPTAHLLQIAHLPYHMALAHIAAEDSEYRGFYEWQAGRLNAFVLLDNGAAELGAGAPVDALMALEAAIFPDEIVLPDVVGDAGGTLERSQDALLRGLGSGCGRAMAVPQGRTKEEYLACLREMLSWPGVTTIGVSKFAVRDSMWSNRAELLDDCPELRSSKLDIHLLGAVVGVEEILQVECLFPGRVRGCDSSLPTLYAERGLVLGDGPRPHGEIPFDALLDMRLLSINVDMWCAGITVRQGGM